MGSYEKRLERRNKKDKMGGRLSLSPIVEEPIKREPAVLRKKRVRRTRAQIEADKKAQEELKLQEGSNLE